MSECISDGFMHILKASWGQFENIIFCRAWRPVLSTGPAAFLRRFAVEFEDNKVLGSHTVEIAGSNSGIVIGKL